MFYGIYQYWPIAFTPAQVNLGLSRDNVMGGTGGCALCHPPAEGPPSQGADYGANAVPRIFSTSVTQE